MTCPPISSLVSSLFSNDDRMQRAFSGALHAQRHDRVDYIIVILLQCLDGLLPRHRSLLHNELDILALEALLIDLLVIVVFLLLLGIAGVNSLALAVVVARVGVCLRLNHLLDSGGLCLGVEVLNLGLTEDDPGVAGWGLVDVWAVDDEENALRPPQSDPRDALNMLQTKFRNRLAGLLLIARVDGDRAASWDGGISAFAGVNVGIRVGAAVLNLGGLLLWLVGELLDAWVGHVCGSANFV